MKECSISKEKEAKPKKGEAFQPTSNSRAPPNDLPSKCKCGGRGSYKTCDSLRVYHARPPAARRRRCLHGCRCDRGVDCVFPHCACWPALRTLARCSPARVAARGREVPAEGGEAMPGGSRSAGLISGSDSASVSLPASLQLTFLPPFCFSCPPARWCLRVIPPQLLWRRHQAQGARDRRHDHLHGP